MYEWIGRFTQNERKVRRWALAFGLLPRWFVFGVLTAAGLLLYVSSREWRSTVAANMTELLDACRPHEIRRHTRRYFMNLAVTLYELVLDSSRLGEQGGKLIAVDGEEHLEEALQEGKGAILYAPHVGNFFYTYWKLSRRYNGLAVATASSPELRPLYLTFERLGCRGLDYDAVPPLDLIRQLKAHLAAGGFVFILGDFYRPNFPETRLFGKTTRAPAGAAALALELQVPVVPCYGFRERGFYHRVVLGKPVKLSEAFTRKQRAEALQSLAVYLEEPIRNNPDQWFYWFDAHERWEHEVTPPEPSESASPSGAAEYQTTQAAL